MEKYSRIRTSAEFFNLVQTLKKNMKFKNDVVTTDYIRKIFLNANMPKVFEYRKKKRFSFIEPI